MKCRSLVAAVVLGTATATLFAADSSIGELLGVAVGSEDLTVRVRDRLLGRLGGQATRR